MILDCNRSISIGQESSIHEMENFAEVLCDQLFINETYFGNILMTLSELYNLLIPQTSTNPVKLSYNTDFLLLNIVFEGLNKSLLEALNTQVDLNDLSDEPEQERLFLIQTLTDGIEILDENNLQISFDISAIHNKIYQQRAEFLRAFFKKHAGVAVKSNDAHH